MMWWAWLLLGLVAYSVALVSVVAFFMGAFRATYVPPAPDPDDWFDERV